MDTVSIGYTFFVCLVIVNSVVVIHIFLNSSYFHKLISFYYEHVRLKISFDDNEIIF